MNVKRKFIQRKKFVEKSYYDLRKVKLVNLENLFMTLNKFRKFHEKLFMTKEKLSLETQKIYL